MYKCTLCGRDKFTRKSPHNCVGGFRKRKILWEEIIPDINITKADVKIDKLALIAKCTDGKYRQVLFSDNMQSNTLSAIALFEQSVKLVDKEIEGISF